MKVLTWNVNSIKVRLQRLLAVLERHRPDVVCLQETKTVDDTFPLTEINDAGYDAAPFGQKTYNGVALLSRKELKDIRRSFADEVDDPQARLISAEVNGVRVISGYFPNGSTVGSEKYAYKLAWIARLRELLIRDFSPDQPLLVCGDTNIAIRDNDVANPESWADTVLCAPQGRSALANLCEWGLVDLFGEKYPDGGVYSWWDYRNLAFPKNDGLRIDHILGTRSMADRCRNITIDRDERRGTKDDKPSDHVPVIAEFDW